MNAGQARRSCLVLFVGVLVSVRPAFATTIAIGVRITIDATTFAVPIDISDGLDVSGWQFDLAYDATDLQVNDACDPFSGDVYCSLFTGAVTSGDFFASAAPFNLLNPGFIALDPATLAQTGSLFGVNGTFGGPAPYPSGRGTLAFVEFSVLGDGDSEISVNGSVLSPSEVPEPGTMVLLTTGLLVPAVQRWRSARRS